MAFSDFLENDNFSASYNKRKEDNSPKVSWRPYIRYFKILDPAVTSPDLRTDSVLSHAMSGVPHATL